jgi:tetratricopeptide (TPR) repeat protein
MYLFLGVGLGLAAQACKEERRLALVGSLFFILLASLSREDGILGFPLLFFLAKGRRLEVALGALPLILLWGGIRVFALSRFLGGGGDLLRGAGLGDRMLAGADWFAHSIQMLLLVEPPRILSGGIPNSHWMRILLPLYLLGFVLAFFLRAPRILRFVLFWTFLGSLPFLRMTPLAEGLAGRYALVLLPPISLGLGALWGRLKPPKPLLLFCPLLLFPWTLKQWRTIAQEESAYLQVLEVDPGDRRALSLLGNALESSGKNLEALRVYRTLKERFPGYPKAWVNMGNLLFRMGQKNQGLRVLQESSRRFPNHALAWLSLGRAFFALGKNLEAGEAFQKALHLSPQLGQAARYLCRSQLQLGNVEAASAALKEASRIDPGHPSLSYLVRNLTMLRSK